MACADGYGRRTRKLIVLVALVAVLVAGDLVARRVAEGQLARRVENTVSAKGVPVDNVKVSIDSFPFLGRLGLSGNVSRVRASASGVEAGGVRYESIVVNLHDVRLDRDRLFSGQLSVKSVGHGEADGEITQADLRRALGGVPVVLGAGTIGVTVSGVTASAAASVTNGVLTLSAGGLSLPAVTLPKTPLLPCVTRTVVLPGRLLLTCAIDRVPEMLR